MSNAQLIKEMIRYSTSFSRNAPVAAGNCPILSLPVGCRVHGTEVQKNTHYQGSAASMWTWKSARQRGLPSDFHPHLKLVSHGGGNEISYHYFSFSNIESCVFLHHTQL